MDVVTAITERYSCRKFKPTALDAGQEQRLATAALAAPTARNLRALFFNFVSDPDLLDAISAACVDLNPELPGILKQRSAETIFYGAPTVVFITAKPVAYAFLDAGIAAQNIALAATSEGLASCIIGFAGAAFTAGPDRSFYRAIGAGEEELFQIAVAVGYPAAKKKPHEPKEGQIRFIRKIKS